MVVEKPFGRDSIRALNATLQSVFDDSDVFASTTISAKRRSKISSTFDSAIRSSSRFGTGAASRGSIVTMAESFGVEGRGRMYDETGAIRDVVQNHLLQVIACLAIEEPPATHDAEGLRDAKTNLLRAVRPLVPADVVRGQFRGYADEPGVAKDSHVETFAAVRLRIDSWRWADVPFFVRAGKCLPDTSGDRRDVQAAAVLGVQRIDVVARASEPPSHSVEPPRRDRARPPIQGGRRSDGRRRRRSRDEARHDRADERVRAILRMQ